jgi:hypothetical protein
MWICAAIDDQNAQLTCVTMMNGWTPVCGAVARTAMSVIRTIVAILGRGATKIKIFVKAGTPTSSNGLPMLITPPNTA